MPQLILADQGYPLEQQVLIPFREALIATDSRRKAFNRAVSKTRIIVENVIGRLKRRFGILNNLSNRVDNTPRFILAAGVLYNVYHSLNLIDLDDLFEGYGLGDDEDGQ